MATWQRNGSNGHSEWTCFFSYRNFRPKISVNGKSPDFYNKISRDDFYDNIEGFGTSYIVDYETIDNREMYIQMIYEQTGLSLSDYIVKGKEFISGLHPGDRLIFINTEDFPRYKGLYNEKVIFVESNPIDENTGKTRDLWIKYIYNGKLYVSPYHYLKYNL